MTKDIEAEDVSITLPHTSPEAMKIRLAYIHAQLQGRRGLLSRWQRSKIYLLAVKISRYESMYHPLSRDYLMLHQGRREDFQQHQDMTSALKTQGSAAVDYPQQVKEIEAYVNAIRSKNGEADSKGPITQQGYLTETATRSLASEGIFAPKQHPWYDPKKLGLNLAKVGMAAAVNTYSVQQILLAQEMEVPITVILVGSLVFAALTLYFIQFCTRHLVGTVGRLKWVYGAAGVATMLIYVIAEYALNAGGAARAMAAGSQGATLEPVSGSSHGMNPVLIYVTVIVLVSSMLAVFEGIPQGLADQYQRALKQRESELLADPDMVDDLEVIAWKKILENRMEKDSQPWTPAQVAASHENVLDAESLLDKAPRSRSWKELQRLEREINRALSSLLLPA